jgi:hypothetical protein
MDMENGVVEEIGLLLIDEAQQRFQQCDAQNDFCIQDVGINVIFGGTNRLIWSPRQGFILDKLYCTQQFIKKYEEQY